MQILIPTLLSCRVQPSPCPYAPTLLHSIHTGLCGFGFGPECNSVVSHYLDRLNEAAARFPSPHSSTYLTCHHIYTYRQTHVSKLWLTLSHGKLFVKYVVPTPALSGQLRLRLCGAFP